MAQASDLMHDLVSDHRDQLKAVQSKASDLGQKASDLGQIVRELPDSALRTGQEQLQRSRKQIKKSRKQIEKSRKRAEGQLQKGRKQAAGQLKKAQSAAPVKSGSRLKAPLALIVVAIVAAALYKAFGSSGQDSYESPAS